MKRTRLTIVLAAHLACAAVPAEAHGNLGIPAWYLYALLGYYFWFGLLFVSAFAAALDRNAAPWLRWAVPIAVCAYLFIYFMFANRTSFHDEVVVAFSTLLLPTFFSGLWLLGVILRKRDT